MTQFLSRFYVTHRDIGDLTIETDIRVTGVVYENRHPVDFFLGNWAQVETVVNLKGEVPDGLGDLGKLLGSNNMARLHRDYLTLLDLLLSENPSTL